MSQTRLTAKLHVVDNQILGFGFAGLGPSGEGGARAGASPKGRAHPAGEAGADGEEI